MARNRYSRALSVFLIPIIFFFAYEHFLGISWRHMHWQSQGWELRGDRVNIRGGFFSTLKISCGSLAVETKPENTDSEGDRLILADDAQSELLSISDKALARDLPLIWRWLSHIKVSVQSLTIDSHVFNNVRASVICDKKYHYMDLKELSFGSYAHADRSIYVHSFQQSNCVQIDLLHKKVFINFKDPTQVTLDQSDLPIGVTMQGHIESQGFFFQGSLELATLLFLDTVSYQWDSDSLTFHGKDNNVLKAQSLQENWLFEGKWTLSQDLNIPSLPPIDCTISHILYQSSKDLIEADYVMEAANNTLKGKALFDMSSQMLKADFDAISLPIAANFQGDGTFLYKDRHIRSLLKGCIDDPSALKRPVELLIVDNVAELTHKDLSNPQGDWKSIEVSWDPLKSSWSTTVHGIAKDIEWVGSFDRGSEILDLYVGSAQGFPFYAQGRLTWTEDQIDLDHVQISTDWLLIQDYEWTGSFHRLTNAISVSGRPDRIGPPVIAVMAPLLKDTPWYHMPFTADCNGPWLIASLENTPQSLNITAKKIDADRLMSLLPPKSHSHSKLSDLQERWLETPFPFFVDPININLSADLLVWNDYEFPKVTLEHTYSQNPIEHRWNMRYREGSACFREYYEEDVWKHEVTVVLSSGEALDSSLKGGLWILSLYHDPLIDKNIMWHLKAEDLFVEKLQHSFFTGLNILSGRAFSPKQSRSLWEDGVVIEKVNGRGTINADAVSVTSMDLHAGPVTIHAKGNYYPFIDDLQIDLIVRPKISQALTSLATILSPWTAGFAWVGAKSIGKEVDTWNEQLYHLRGSSDHWEIMPWEPEVLSLPLDPE